MCLLVVAVPVRRSYCVNVSASLLPISVKNEARFADLLRIL
ncbi:hypothetical protein RGUI_3977 [Rhodovulum sp. P5]|nr:hypothetical protein RGUI_3977 [Rhodovulum sp. P5]